MDTNKGKYIGWVRVLAMIIPYFIIVAIFQFLGSWVSGIKFMETEIDKTTEQQAIVSFFSLVGTFLVIWIFNTFWDKEKFIQLGFQTKNRLKEFTVGLVLGASVIGLGYLLFLTFGQICFLKVEFDGKELLLTIVVFLFFGFCST